VNIAEKLGHECLAEASYLAITLAFWVEIRTSFSSSHGKAGESVFENLFKPKEFQNTFVYRRVKPKSSYVNAKAKVNWEDESDR